MEAEMQKELQMIKIRNARVEADKAWETSKARRGILAGMTYVLAVILFIIINAPSPFLTALVPAVAYLLSTLTLPFLKEWWMNRVYRKR